MNIKTRRWLMGSVSMDAVMARLKSEAIEVAYKFQKIIEDDHGTMVI